MQPGDCVLARYPLDEGGYKTRPCLVLSVSSKLGSEPLACIAKGTSKVVSPGAVQPWELLIRPEDGRSVWEASGLRVPTIFTLEKMHVFPIRDLRRIGMLHMSLAPRVEAILTAAQKRGWLH